MSRLKHMVGPRSYTALQRMRCNGNGIRVSDDSDFEDEDEKDDEKKDDEKKNDEKTDDEKKDDEEMDDGKKAD
eukprot:COSAG02_NODE_15968_length_1124_cov_2.112195_1_plen_73_part_00